MLKWTASAQRLAAETKVNLHASQSAVMAAAVCRPRFNMKNPPKRRATIANKENVPISTSTPVVNRARNSPLALAPMADVLNVTPEALRNRTLERKKRLSIKTFDNRNITTKRRHSTVGFSISETSQYATTLPKYEEEYSPSTVLATGQQLALRGLLPDLFMDNPRYFTTPPLAHKEQTSSVTKKRKLEQEFLVIAQEEEETAFGDFKQQHNKKKDFNHTGLMSNKMGDQTLDKLIDAILDSARKEEKKKKPRKSFNLRRRTLLKNQIEQHEDKTLSPSYAAGDDPCSDLSFVTGEHLNYPTNIQDIMSTAVATPRPATPPPGTALSHQILLELPTPAKRNNPFSVIPPKVSSKLKRRSESMARSEVKAKKYKPDSQNYFEVGVALPSIYV